MSKLLFYDTHLIIRNVYVLPNEHISTYFIWCLHLDSNQEPSDYESLATNQLCYRGIILWCDCPESNRDAVKREILSLLCLPISPQSQIILLLYNKCKFLSNIIFYFHQLIFHELTLTDHPHNELQHLSFHFLIAIFGSLKK